MIRLTWPAFDLAVERIARRILAHDNVDALYAIPRGGLVLGVALSHYTGLPLMPRLRPGVVAVDDIIDTGKTLAGIRQEHGNLLAAAWIVRSRAGASNCIASAVVDHSEWFLFPWECEGAAADDERQFNASR